MNVAVVGCGNISLKHISAWSKSNDKVIAVLDIDLRRANSVAEEYGINYAISNLEDLLYKKDPLQLDVIDICTPPSTHYDIIIKSLEIGVKNILVEKPLALNVGECNDIITMAQKREANICVGHNYLFKISIQRLRSLMYQGKLGDIKQIDIHHMNSDDLVSTFPKWVNNLPAGVFGESGPHPIYIMQALNNDILQREVEVFSKEHATIRFKGKEVCGNISMFYGGTPRTEWTINVYGSEMMAHVDVYRDVLVLMGPRLTKPVSFVTSKIIDSLRLMLGTITNASSSILKGSQNDTHEKLILNFSEFCKRKISPPPNCSLSDGKRVVEVIDTIAYEIRKLGLK